MVFKLIQTSLTIYVIILNFHQHKSQTCPTLENNTDFFGSDITYSAASSVTFCCSNCAALPGCTSISFVSSVNICWLKNATAATVRRIATNGRISAFIINPVTTTTRATPVTTTTAPTTTTSTTTRPTTTTTTSTLSTTTTTTRSSVTTQPYGCFIEYNINYYGNDYNAAFTGTASDCCNLCGADLKCLVWSYLTDAQYCFLKNALPSYDQRQNYTNSISGIVVLR